MKTNRTLTIGGKTKRWTEELRLVTCNRCLYNGMAKMVYKGKMWRFINSKDAYCPTCGGELSD